MRVKKLKLDDIEYQALIGIVVNTAFLKKIRGKLRAEHFKTKYGGVILNWVYKYYDEYGQAPSREIENVYNENKKKFNKEIEELVNGFIDKLSQKYESQGDTNPEYLYDRTLEYIRKRDLENLRDKLTKELDRDRVGNASAALIDFQTVHKETSKIFNPYDVKYVNKNFIDIEEDSGIFTLHGDIGKLLGSLDRGWLVTFTAPEKRGKSWWLIEMAFQAITQNLNVVFVSLEMSEKDIRNRFWKRGTAGYSGSSKKIIVPVFDCLRNQDGSCRRYSKRKIFDENGVLPLYSEVRRGYSPCVECLGEFTKKRRCVTSVWYEKMSVKEYKRNLVVEKASMIEEMFGKKLRVMCYPTESVNTVDLKNLINELEVNEDFVTDVLITDYLDILGDEPGARGERDNIDKRWKRSKGLAREKSLLHITADQSHKRTYETDIKLADTSEDKRKNAHVDLKIALNEMKIGREVIAEDDIKVLRVNVLAHRHKTFNKINEVVVLQHLGLGQPLLDNVLRVKEVPRRRKGLRTKK